VLEVEEQELIQRLLSRAAKEGRSDDNLESIRKRLEVYHAQTAPLIAYYEKQGVVKRVEGSGGVEEIHSRLARAVGAGG
jgi:adenylate kinase